MYTGGCLCGDVRYRIDGPIRDVIACHCEQCRRASGHYVAASAAHPKHLTITRTEGLSWYEGTSHIRRGFCTRCGSTLFFDHGPDYPTGIAAGSLDDSTQVKIAAHIWIDEGGGYYQIPETEPAFTSSQWREQTGWDPLSWTDGADHVSGAKQFKDY